MARQDVQPGGPAPAAVRMPWSGSVLWDRQPQREPVAQDGDFLSDLCLDQVIEAVAGRGDERDLIAGVLRSRLRDPVALRYRHEVFRDLEDAGLAEGVRAFCGRMAQVRSPRRPP